MQDPQTFEQQLSALAPAAIETDASAAMYRCGFAAGQASRSAAPARSRPRWLQLVAAACLTAVLVGPVSYRLGHVPASVTIVEQAPAAAVPIVDQGAAPQSTAEMPENKPAEPANAPPKFADVSEPSSTSQPLSPLFGGWLIGMTPPPASLPITAPSTDIVLTSRPPSADTMAWLEQSRPKQSNSLFAIPDTPSSKEHDQKSNRFRLPPLPSRNSLDTWEPWTQS